MSYKDRVLSLGFSDYATLVAVGFESEKGIKSELIKYGGDSSYKAYVVNENVEIPKHYKLVVSFDKWVKVYNDVGLVLDVLADKINIYRAGEFGTLIQLVNEKKVLEVD